MTNVLAAPVAKRTEPALLASLMSDNAADRQISANQKGRSAIAVTPRRAAISRAVRSRL